jgi:GNAT superfamily N-acetyltransferase
MITVRLDICPMTLEDLPSIDRIQRDAYDEYFLEDLAVFADKLQRCPEGCWVCVTDVGPVGYMFSHPAQLSLPPALNQMIENGNSTDKDDCYFIHDVAVMRSHRGRRIGRRLVAQAFRIASTHGHAVVALVSVQGSRAYWQGLGFQPLLGPQETLNYIRQSYGDAACYMVQPVA